MISDLTKITIIDDEEDLCFLLSSMLINNGYNVNYSHTIKEGLAAIEKEKPNWVIIDNNLPDGLGWEKSDDILKLDETINIIKISANPDSPRNDNRYNIHYLIKPIKVKAVIELIEKQK